MNTRNQRLTWPGYCFGCSSRNEHGLHLHFDRTAQGCLTTHSVAGHHCGIEGIAHGGIVSTLLDEVAAWALILHAQQNGLTTEMNVRFLSPVPVATPIKCEAWIVSREAKRATTRAEIRGADGHVLASADAKWALVSAAYVARASGLPREQLDRFYNAVRARAAD